MIEPAKRTTQFRYAIRDIVAAAESLERRGREVLHLNIGDPQAFGFRPPAIVTEAVVRALQDRFTGYAHSAGLLEAREAVANYAVSFGAPTEPADVILASGASEAADLALTALLDPGDEVLIPVPGYPIYPAILTKLGAVPSSYRLHTEYNWQPDVEEIRSMIGGRTRAIILINPNNPTGSVTNDNITRQILEIARENNLLVISDEVYRDLCFVTAPTSASVVAAETKVPLITLESLSKTHMLSGWRIGWMRFTNADKMRELVSAITRLASGRLCSPTPAQYAVKPALEMDLSFRQEFIAHLIRNRDFAVSGIRSIDGLSCVTPHAAFYLMVKAERTGGLTDDVFVRHMLEATGILVVPGSGFGCDPSEGYFRMVFLADQEVLSKAIEQISAFVGSEARETVAGSRP